MSSLVGRFRRWAASVEFAVTATAVAAALVAAPLAFEYGGSVDGYFVLLLAGVAVPSVYENQWPTGYDGRVAGAAWALAASAAVVACYGVLAAGLQALATGFLPKAVAFATTWVLSILAAGAPAGDAA